MKAPARERCVSGPKGISTVQPSTRRYRKVHLETEYTKLEIPRFRTMKLEIRSWESRAAGNQIQRPALSFGSFREYVRKSVARNVEKCHTRCEMRLNMASYTAEKSSPKSKSPRCTPYPGQAPQFMINQLRHGGVGFRSPCFGRLEGSMACFAEPQEGSSNWCRHDCNPEMPAGGRYSQHAHSSGPRARASSHVIPRFKQPWGATPGHPAGAPKCAGVGAGAAARSSSRKTGLRIHLREAKQPFPGARAQIAKRSPDTTIAEIQSQENAACAAAVPSRF